jgi:hypothetical protein
MRLGRWARNHFGAQSSEQFVLAAFASGVVACVLFLGHSSWLVFICR